MTHILFILFLHISVQIINPFCMTSTFLFDVGLLRSYIYFKHLKKILRSYFVNSGYTIYIVDNFSKILDNYL